MNNNINTYIIYVISSSKRVTKKQLHYYYNLSNYQIRKIIKYHNTHNLNFLIKYDNNGYYMENKELFKYEVRHIFNDTITINLEICKIINTLICKLKNRKSTYFIEIQKKVLNNTLNKYNFEDIDTLLKYNSDEIIYIIVSLTLLKKNVDDFEKSYLNLESQIWGFICEQDFIYAKDQSHLIANLIISSYPKHSINYHLFYSVYYLGLVYASLGFKITDDCSNDLNLFNFNIKYPNFISKNILSTLLILDNELVYDSNINEDYFFKYIKKLELICVNSFFLHNGTKSIKYTCFYEYDRLLNKYSNLNISPIVLKRSINLLLITWLDRINHTNFASNENNEFDKLIVIKSIKSPLFKINFYDLQSDFLYVNNNVFKVGIYQTEDLEMINIAAIYSGLGIVSLAKKDITIVLGGTPTMSYVIKFVLKINFPNYKINYIGDYYGIKNFNNLSLHNVYGNTISSKFKPLPFRDSISFNYPIFVI